MPQSLITGAALLATRMDLLVVCSTRVDAAGAGAKLDDLSRKGGWKINQGTSRDTDFH